MRATARIGLVISVVSWSLVACSSFQAKPPVTIYDLGAGSAGGQGGDGRSGFGASAPVTTALPVLLADVEAPPALESTAILYRLAYSDAQQVRPYAQARWSMAPSQLLRQRLKERLSDDRAVLHATQGAARKRSLRLQVELDEFAQHFESPQASAGVVRLRATLGQIDGGKEHLLAQRSFFARHAGTTADAAGGAHALAAATDSLVAQIAQWVQGLEAQTSKSKE